MLFVALTAIVTTCRSGLVLRACEGHKEFETTLGGGSLGSYVDEERSELRDLV